MSTIDLSTDEKKLLTKKTAEAYIEACRHVNLSSGRKAFITRLWLEKHNKSIEDIEFARNRNPYWKKQKMKGSDVRNIIRRDQHNYSKAPRKIWTQKDVTRLYENNDKKDWELAKLFQVGIPSIQARRRSLNAARKIFDLQGKKANKQKLIELSMRGDKYLMKMLKDMKKNK